MDMAPGVVINTFKNGAIPDIFWLNIHHLIWKSLRLLLRCNSFF
jgi:hypothetical protein